MNVAHHTIRKGAFALANRYNRRIMDVKNLSAHGWRVSVYRFNVAVNRLLSKDIRRKNSDKHRGLISLQRWCACLMQNKVADETRGLESLRGAIASEVHLGRMILVHMKVFDSKHRHECYDEHPCQKTSEVFVTVHVQNACFMPIGHLSCAPLFYFARSSAGQKYDKRTNLVCEKCIC